ncbi:glycosyl transferase family protein [Aliihoeflea sp. PC F10.4]
MSGAGSTEDDARGGDTLGQLRLLVALDALLVAGSAKGAAAQLGIGVPAMSRLLAQIRDMFGDEIVTRTGRGFVPTPFAENLRIRLRAVASEVDNIVRGASSPASNAQSADRPLLIQSPPLAMRPAVILEGQPDPSFHARRLSEIGADAPAQARLARYIATVGAGAGRSRSLTPQEAEDAFSIIVEGEADPVQIGAFLIALQYRNPTANELAGMVRAARRGAPPSPIADLDWPAYLSPRDTRPPWFLHAARLVAGTGRRVLLHGFANHGDPLDAAMRIGSIARCLSLEDAQMALDRHNIAYLPLAAVDPQLQALIALYRQFEMRSPLNLIVQLLNPASAPATILGVPAGALHSLHQEAALQLGWPRLLTIGSHRDVAQATPFRRSEVKLQADGGISQFQMAALSRASASRRLDGYSSLEYWQAVWDDAAKDEDAEETIVATAAFALLAIGEHRSYEEAHDTARRSWNGRHRG